MQTQSHRYSSRARKDLARLAISVPFIVLVMTTPALAATLLMGQKQTCTSLNCNAFEIRGAVTGRGTAISNPRAVPWVGQIAANAGSCLRFDVVSSTNFRFLEMTVISPNNGVRTVGTITADPDKDCCPKLKVGSVPQSGYYTVILNNNGGDPNPQGTFFLKYQEYDAGNPNCKNPTPQQ